MPEGVLCNKNKVTTLEQLQALLADKSGKQYYQEMNHLEVDPKGLGDLFRKPANRAPHLAGDLHPLRPLRRELLLLPGQRPRPDAGALLQDPEHPGADRAAQGAGGQRLHADGMDTAFSKCTCCTAAGSTARSGSTWGSCSATARPALLPGLHPLGDEDRHRHAPRLPGPDGCDHRGLGGDLRVDGRGDRGRVAGAGDPIDKENADIMYTVNAREPKHYPEDIAEAAILFHIAGENWTVPSEGWEETSLAMFAGDWEACKMQVESVYAPWRSSSPNAWWSPSAATPTGPL
jgi:hypothetical protein